MPARINCFAACSLQALHRKVIGFKLCHYDHGCTVIMALTPLQQLPGHCFPDPQKVTAVAASGLRKT